MTPKPDLVPWTYTELEAAVRKMAHDLPPSDLGSTRAIQHVTRFCMNLLQEALERAAQKPST